MFRSHPIISEFPKRNHHTVYAHENATLLDVPLSTTVATPMNTGRLLFTVNDLQKIIQITANDLIGSNKIDIVTNMNLKYVLSLIYISIHKNVYAEVSNKQMVYLVVCSAEEIIEYYIRSNRTRKRLILRLSDQDVIAFIGKLITQPVVKEECGYRMKNDIGCFDWIRNLFG